MKSLLWLAAAASLALGLVGSRTDEEHVLIVGGDAHGMVQPCGCVKPMTGGILRRIAAIRKASVPGRTTVIDTGRFVSGQSRQDQLKAETLAECLKLVGVKAINLAREDAALGEANLASVDRLSGHAFASTSLESPSHAGLQDLVTDGPLLIGSVEPDTKRLGQALPEERTLDASEAAKRLVDEASRQGLVPILMTRGDIEEARQLATQHPELRAVIYKHDGNPPEALEWLGKTALVTPGEKGKVLVRLVVKGGMVTSYRLAHLGPEVQDDKEATRLFRGYLDRVRDEGLLAKLPRTSTDKYAGTSSCLPCHAGPAKVWKKSAHAIAFASLEQQAEQFDPECVSCHVVGQDSKYGFAGKQTTPTLVNVGCESCHGPGKAHAANPSKSNIRRAGQASCAKCHTLEHSPTFEFKLYWKKIRH